MKNTEVAEWHILSSVVCGRRSDQPAAVFAKSSHTPSKLSATSSSESSHFTPSDIEPKSPTQSPQPTL